MNSKALEQGFFYFDPGFSPMVRDILSVAKDLVYLRKGRDFMHRLIRGLIVGSLIGAATGGAMIARNRMMHKTMMSRSLSGRARRTMMMAHKKVWRLGDAVKDGAWAFTRRLLD